MPFEAESVKEILTKHTLEHIENLIPLMREIYRVCVPDASVRIVVPYFSSPGASQDPSHRRFFTWHTFDYFEEGSRLCFHGMGLFRIKSKKIHILKSVPLFGNLLSRLFTKIPRIYERFFAYLIPATEIEYVLRPIK